MIRVALAIEHSVPRWALRVALGHEADLEVVGDAGTVADTLSLISRVVPDVLVVDPAVPDHGQFDVLDELRELDHGPLVLALSPREDPAYAARALAMGAHGYVATSSSPAVLIGAIRAVSQGEQVVPLGATAPGADDPGRHLTRREVQIMEMLARGMTNGEIAHDLGISTKTIDTHRGHLLKKLGLRNNAELTRFALKHGYVAV